MSNKIVTRDVVIIYRGKHDQEPVIACNGINIEVEEGAFVSIVGPSGCGKTTLLYAIDGLLPINQGEICVDDKPITGPGTDRAMVFQSASLLPWRTVWANITYGVTLQNTLDPQHKDKVEPYRYGRFAWLRRALPLGTFRRHAAARQPRQSACRGPGYLASRRAIRIG